MNTYKPVKRKYYDWNDTAKESYFIAQGQMADGHLAYTRCDKDGEPINEEDTCSYIQVRSDEGLIMIRI